MLGEVILGLIVNLLSSFIYEEIKLDELGYFQARKIKSRIVDATADIIEPLLPFLQREGLSEAQQRLLIEICVLELRPVTMDSSALFRGSLNGQKIFDQLYASGSLPQAITDEGLQDTYTLLFPRIAAIICQVPAAVKNWEHEAWAENYRRLDDIVMQLRALFHVVDAMQRIPEHDADQTLALVRRSLAQRVRLELDLTGLRADQTVMGKFDAFFVHPAFKLDVPNFAEELSDNKSTFARFTKLDHWATVVGGPGAGKSTWSRWLEREALSNKWDGIAIRVELRGVQTKALPSLLGLVREIAGPVLAEEITQDRFKKWIENTKILLIFDGFDEIAVTNRDTILAWILDIGAIIQKCPILITSRLLTTNHLERLDSDWSPWKIEPFDKARIIEYIERWHAAISLISDTARKIDASDLAERWQQDPTLAPLTSNPLLLSTLLMVHHLDGSLPNGRAQLYQRYVNGMLGLWDDRRKIDSIYLPITLQQKRKIMCGLALYMFINERDEVEEDNVLHWLDEFLEEMQLDRPKELVLAVLRERTGLLVGPGMYSFSHKSVAEYFVAEAVFQGDQRDSAGKRIDRLSLLEHADDDRWNTVIFIWAGLAPISDVESFIEVCMRNNVWDLAFGILYDQYIRFAPSVRHKFLKASEYESCEMFNDTSVWITSGFKDIRSDVEQLRLRSLGLEIELEDLVAMAISDGTIKVEDYITCHPDIQHSIWKSITRNPPDLESWKEIVTLYRDHALYSRERLLISVSWLIGRTQLGYYPWDVISSIKAAISVHPEVDGAAISIMMAMVVSRYNLARKDDADERIDKVVTTILNTLPALVSQEVNGVSDKILLDTLGWKGRHSYENPDYPNVGAQDILLQFLEIIQEPAILSKIQRDANFKRAEAYVKDLLRKRDALV